VLLSSGALAIGVGCCIAGLLAKDAGYAIRARSLDDDVWYNASEEEYRFTIIRQWHKHIDNLEKLLDARRRYLNIALVLIAFVAGLLAVTKLLSPLTVNLEYMRDIFLRRFIRV